MSRFTQEVDQGDGWSDWIQPVMIGYKMACCDCGLVHTMDFRALRVIAGNERGFDAEELDIEKFRVEFRLRRNNRSTGQIRRHMRNE